MVGGKNGVEYPRFKTYDEGLFGRDWSIYGGIMVFGLRLEL